MDSKIYSVSAREILDSRGSPTVETTVILESGYRGIAGVPSGVSTGKYEALELRDNDPARYDGLGVLTAVRSVNTEINNKLKGVDVFGQGVIDQMLVELDGTPNKSRLGANAILSASLAAAIAAASAKRTPLYRYFQSLTQQHPELAKMPTPLFNLIEGGKHATGTIDFQEFHVIPATSNKFAAALQMGVEFMHAVKHVLTYRNAAHGVGDEGGFAPNLLTNAEVFDVFAEAAKETRYKPGIDLFYGIDVAASSFQKGSGYQIKDSSQPFNSLGFAQYFKKLHEKYPILLLEDPMGEDDWEGWKLVMHEVGPDVLIVGDDLLATNPTRLTRAIEEKSCSAILLKPNQIGTLSEFLAVVFQAKQHDIKTIVSHRGGETNDSYIADLAVAVQSDYVKFGAPVRGERVAKYNRLLQIETEFFATRPS